jgi:hypothetical protein
MYGRGNSFDRDAYKPSNNSYGTYSGNTSGVSNVEKFGSYRVPDYDT